MHPRLVATFVLLSLAARSAAQTTGVAAEAPPDPVIPAPSGEASPPLPPIGPARVAIDLRPRIFVKDLDHLAELVKEDSAIAARARSLAGRRTTALALGGGLMVAGIAVSVAGFGNKSCHAEAVPFPGSGSLQVCEGDMTQAFVGAGIMLAGSVLALLLAPGANDLLDVINDWNVAHPDRPFELTGGHHPMLDQIAAPKAR